MYDVHNLHDATATAVSSLDAAAAGESFYQRFFKRGFDVIIATIALIVLLPALLVIAGLVRLKLGPGVLYRQARVGRDGQNFVMLKFRTMRPPAVTPDGTVETDDLHATHKTSDHPRLTQFGRTLRRLSLDELPQLWNIMRGQMSLVGPRPELSEKVDNYGLRSHPRHVVRPGLTGEWQVTHRSSGVHLIHCFDDDMEYVSRISLSHDLGIIARTVGVVFGAKGV